MATNGDHLRQPRSCVGCVYLVDDRSGRLRGGHVLGFETSAPDVADPPGVCTLEPPRQLPTSGLAVAAYPPAIARCGDFLAADFDVADLPTDVRRLNTDDVEAIMSSVEWRQAHITNESLLLSIGVVLMNYGDQLTPVWCVGGEWSGTKGDLPRPAVGRIPHCPSGHVLTEGRPRYRLALVPEVE